MTCKTLNKFFISLSLKVGLSDNLLFFFKYMLKKVNSMNNSSSEALSK